jgi:hypothetical protein
MIKNPLKTPNGVSKMTYQRSSYAISLYNPSKSRPESGLDRLVVLGWKGNKETGRVGHNARCFSMPMWVPELQGKDSGFTEILITAVEEIQRKIAHEYVGKELDRGYACVEIPSYLVAPEACLSRFIEEQEESSGRGKLSGVQIENWYKEKLGDLVAINIMERYGWMKEDYKMNEADNKQLEQGVNGYRAVLSRLANPVPNIEIKAARKLVEALELLGNEGKNDPVARKLGRKLDGIINPVGKEVTLVDLM